MNGHALGWSTIITCVLFYSQYTFLFFFFFGWFGSYLSFILYVYQVEQLVTPLMYLVLTELMDGLLFMCSVQEVISLDVPFDMTGCWLRHSLCFFQS